jgi:hypothetical protein
MLFIFLLIYYYNNLKPLPVAQITAIALVSNILESVRKEVVMDQFEDAGIVLSRRLLRPASPE